VGIKKKVLREKVRKHAFDQEKKRRKKTRFRRRKKEIRKEERKHAFDEEKMEDSRPRKKIRNDDLGNAIDREKSKLQEKRKKPRYRPRIKGSFNILLFFFLLSPNSEHGIFKHSSFVTSLIINQIKKSFGS